MTAKRFSKPIKSPHLIEQNRSILAENKNIPALVQELRPQDKI